MKWFVSLVLLSLPAVSWLFQKGYFPMHDDLQAMRHLQMNICFKDRQFPCRWVPDMGYGYGYPLFNYYPPLPYYLGQLVHWAGFSFTGTVKVMGGVGFLASGLTMYLLAREFWGRRGGIISAAFYIYAPYHSTDFYVRAAVNEFWALVFFPLVFWTTYRLIKNGDIKWLPAVSVSISFLFLSHNPMLMIFAPSLVIWCLFWVVKLKAFKALLALGASALWAVGLSSFFTFPVIFESKFVSLWTLTSGYFNYLAHFLDWRQMFIKINWGYGESIFGPNDTMSFAIGYLHWIAPLAILLLTPFVQILRQNSRIIIFAFCFLLFALFLMHWKATPIWQKIKLLEFLQFPWRFLALAIFFSSFLSGAVVFVFNRLLVSCLLLLLLLLNANYFRPRDWWPWVDDNHKFRGELWRLQTTAGIFDYLPKWAPLPPADPPAAAVTFPQGVGDFKIDNRRSNYQKYKLFIDSPTAVAEIQTYYFPGWRVWLDGQEITIDPTRDPLLGRMRLDVPSGPHTLQVILTDTSIRSLGNTLSLISWTAIIVSALFMLKRLLHSPSVRH